MPKDCFEKAFPAFLFSWICASKILSLENSTKTPVLTKYFKLRIEKHLSFFLALLISAYFCVEQCKFSEIVGAPETVTE